jgi:hypothetical protein
MRYLLDANAVIAALNEPNDPLSRRLHAGEVHALLAARGTPIGAYASPPSLANTKPRKHPIQHRLGDGLAGDLAQGGCGGG